MHHPLTRRCCSHFRGGSLSTSRSSRRQWRNPGSLRALHTTPPTWLSWGNSSPDDGKADAIVIGGGPAGIAVVGNLLVKLTHGKVLWIDRSFEGGSINQFYREVPSYSPAGDYLHFARATKAFREICAAAPQPNNAITALEKLDPELTCPLSYAGDMLQLISDGLRKHPQVQSAVGTVSHAARDPRTALWKVTLEPPEKSLADPPWTYRAPMVVYCTGTRPQATHLPLDVSRLTVETGLSPTRLANLLPVDEPRTVAVIGSGHSAVLTLRNLFRLAVMSHRRLRIRWVTRTTRFKYVEELPDSDGVVLNENDGLTGEAALFARTQLEGDVFDRREARAFIQRFVLPDFEAENPKWARYWHGTRKAADRERKRELVENEAMKEHLEGCDYVVQCIGFERNKLPEVRPGLGAVVGPIGKPKRLVFNALSGSFFPNSGPRNQTIGLYGAGSAFPELEFLSEGFRKPANAVWKFMAFAQRMVPRWVDGTRSGHLPGKESREEKRRRGVLHEYY